MRQACLPVPAVIIAEITCFFARVVSCPVLQEDPVCLLLDNLLERRLPAFPRWSCSARGCLFYYLFLAQYSPPVLVCEYHGQLFAGKEPRQGPGFFFLLCLCKAL